MLKILLFVLLLSNCNSIFSQVLTNQSYSDFSILDSLAASGVIMGPGKKQPGIVLTRDQAVDLLSRFHKVRNWKTPDDPFRKALGQLIFKATNPPYDSTASYLKNYPVDSLSIPWDQFYIWEPVRVRVPADIWADAGKQADSLAVRDSAVVAGIIVPSGIDTLKRQSEVHARAELPVGRDTTLMVIVDTLSEVRSAYSEFPFRYFSQPYQGDSLKIAINLLLDYIDSSDTSLISITGIRDRGTQLWLNSSSGRMVRYWLNNGLNDSVTVWIGTPSKNTIGLYLEQGVAFRRPAFQGYVTDARIDVKSQDKTTLQDIKKIYTKSQYWKYRTESSFVMNQGLLTNWVKGGESSVSTALDITAYADYNNKLMLLSSNNFARLKYGLIASSGKGIMKNLDLLETNSKLNHKAFGKFDFSAIMLFKTQIAKGYNYPNDSVPVSKFMNPATLTIGLGLDYKPNKFTSINVSPLSYKGTFVHDTASIDQTKYGIAADKRSKNEPGASFMVTNEFRPFKKITVTNRLQLFTNYINKPQNIDVDWEMIMVASLNWFTDVRLNTHLIFDDDTRTPVKGEEAGSRKTARIQFKELLGFSFVFRF